MKIYDYRSWLTKVFDLLGLGVEEREAATAAEPPIVSNSDFSAVESTAVLHQEEEQVVESTAVLHQEEEQVVESVQTVALDEQGIILLNKIRKFASWDGPDGQRQLDEIRSMFSKGYPGHDDAVLLAVTAGRKLKDFSNIAYKTAVKHGAASREVDDIRRQITAEFGNDPWYKNSIKKSIERGHAARKRRLAAEKSFNRRKPLQPRASGNVVRTVSDKIGTARPAPSAVAVEGLHGSDLRAQKHSAHWTVVIDETGDDFGGFPQGSQGTRSGKFVAIVIPGAPPVLPALPAGWHATECNSENEIDRVFQNVLSAEVGIFGVTVNSLPKTPGERWIDGVGFLIDWILRLLPVEGPSKITVFVENRGPFSKNDNWALVERDCMRRLALAFPKTAGWVDLQVKVVGKDFALGGYADAVAFSWGSKSRCSKARIKESKLLNTCLLNLDARQLLGVWDAFERGVKLSATDWWQLLPEAVQPTTLTAALFDRLGLECRKDLNLWSIYLNETRHQMSGGTVELLRLADAAKWLSFYQPDTAVIPPALQLAWAIVRLARSNHYGDSESAWEQEAVRLAEGLLEECAPLVCHADLHLAVARTNRFDFVGASRALERWIDLPVSVPGLRYWGQVRSSLGQHKAFAGDYKASVAYFDEALSGFARLSDPQISLKEKAQTGVYRMIALMDDASVERAKVRTELEVIVGPIQKAIKRYAIMEQPEKRYFHHLLLRWMVAYGSASEKELYLAQKQHWKTGHGHPWPLIELYRALLLRDSDPAESIVYAHKAADLAFDTAQGPTVRLIGATCRVIATSWGSSWPDAETEFNDLENSLPSARDRIALLRQALVAPKPALELLAQVLPFNFR